MKLYDMEGSEWRQVDLQGGDHWRSKQAYKCGICGCAIMDSISEIMAGF